MQPKYIDYIRTKHSYGEELNVYQDYQQTPADRTQEYVWTGPAVTVKSVKARLTGDVLGSSETIAVDIDKVDDDGTATSLGTFTLDENDAEDVLYIPADLALTGAVINPGETLRVTRDYTAGTPNAPASMIAIQG